MGFVNVFRVWVWSNVFIYFCLLDFRVIAIRPRITKPTTIENVVQSGQRLFLECEGKRPVNWSQNVQDHSEFPDDHFRRWKLNYILNEVHEYPFKTQLELTSASYLDTGYFYCGSDTIDYDDNRNVAKVYVYVNSSTELFTFHNAEEWKHVTGEQGSQLILPCRPTSPDVHVTLQQDDKQIYPLLEDAPQDEQWNYDPHKGFYLDFVPIDLHPLFHCEATAPYSKESQLVNLYVTINQKPDDDVPTPIIRNASEYVMMGESMTLVCYVKVSFATVIHLEWIPPNDVAKKENRYKTETFIPPNQQNNQYKEPTVRLIITNAQKADEGEYTCKASQGKTSRQTRTSVGIQDNSTSFINLNVTSSITENATLDAQWVVNIVAHPIPVTRIWQRPNGEVIKQGSSGKFLIKNNAKTSMLKISDLHLDDSGVYVFTAKNGYTIEQRNLTLYVTDSPKVTFPKDSNDLLEISKSFDLTCIVQAYPKPNVTFFFRPCSPVWNCTSSFEPLNLNKEKKPTEKIIDYKTVQLKTTGVARQSGEYLCKACNPGCRNDTRRIIVTDIPEGFQLVGPMNSPVESEDVSVTCAISLFKYQKVLTWFYTAELGNEMEFNSFTGSFQILKVSSDDSYAETLETSRITFNDSGTYKCQATDLYNNKHNATPVTIKVLAKEPPVIVNVSHPEGLIKAYTGDKVEIKCVATGVPQPTAVWFKDGEVFDNFQSEGATSFVSFEFVKQENAGIYVCKYTSNAGEQEKAFELRVAEHKPVQAGVIVGVVLAAIVFIALLAVLLYKIREEKKRDCVWNVKQLQDFLAGNLECINPDLGIDEQAELLPYDKQWEFPRERLKLGKQLGSGAFGRVLKGEATGITANEAITIVAAKMVKSHANYSAFKALLAELKIMIHLGSHLNVVNLLGACTANITKGELLVLVEYCKYGNLQHYLIRNRENFIDQIDPATGHLDENIGLDQVQKFALSGKNSVFTNDSYDSAGSPNPFNSRNRLPTARTSTSSAMPLGSHRECVTSGVTEATFPEDSSGQSTVINSTGSQIHAPWRSNFRGDFRDTAGPLRTQDLLSWSFQIARGMEYLTSRKVLHGDLAARNILLAENNIVKICDFGLAREVYKNGGNYKKKSDGPLPVKWMAIESITDLVFSTQSDVWSFGIVLWEMFSLGKTPYPDLQADEVFFKKLQSGYRMERPKYATNDMYDIMMDCWRTDPCLRPSFTTLQEMLGDLLEDSVRRHYTDLNNPYNLLNMERKKEDYVDMVSRPDYANVASTPACTSGSDYANLPPENNQGVSDYMCMSPAVGNSSSGQTERLSLTGAGYLFMASSAKSETPDVFSPKSNLPKFSFDFASKLQKVEEESYSMEEIPSKTMSYPEEKNVSFEDTTQHNGKFAADEVPQKYSGSTEQPTRRFFNPSYL